MRIFLDSCADCCDRSRRCQEAGVSEPEFSLADGFMATARRKADVIPGDEALEFTDQVTVEFRRLLMAFHGAMGRADLQVALGLQHVPNFRDC